MGMRGNRTLYCRAALRRDCFITPARPGMCVSLPERRWQCVEVAAAAGAELQRRQAGVQRVRAHQRVVSSRGDDAAALHHGDAICMANGGEAMRDDEHGAPLHQPLECQLHHALALRVERAGGLVEQQDRTVGQNRAGDRQALPLPARQTNAPLSEERVVAIGQRVDEFGRVGRFARGLHFGIGGARAPVADVVEHAGGEDHRLLRHRTARPC